ncbi:hypothetical protein N657DRAFT_277896 [Parathielavia appendiculata]|uniref:Uncharacterized protein n=1 Tax=Parathielavia appendiculata TaxID=2587402 RepID=A0AAN6Z5A0_9PEZI|nr:hypothetical protein N657DRAFT_277896 [Parathielavia appendiculata]
MRVLDSLDIQQKTARHRSTIGFATAKNCLLLSASQENGGGRESKKLRRSNSLSERSAIGSFNANHGAHQGSSEQYNYYRYCRTMMSSLAPRTWARTSNIPQDRKRSEVSVRCFYKLQLHLTGRAPQCTYHIYPRNLLWLVRSRSTVELQRLRGWYMPSVT